MRDPHNSAFYGESDDDRPPLCVVMANLCALTGSEACAQELIEACDYVERVCGPEAMVMPMPDWIQ
jgi:hypothetical protein